MPADTSQEGLGEDPAAARQPPRHRPAVHDAGAAPLGRELPDPPGPTGPGVPGDGPALLDRGDHVAGRPQDALAPVEAEVPLARAAARPSSAGSSGPARVRARASGVRRRAPPTPPRAARRSWSRPAARGPRRRWERLSRRFSLAAAAPALPRCARAHLAPSTPAGGPCARCGPAPRRRPVRAGSGTRHDHHVRSREWRRRPAGTGVVHVRLGRRTRRDLPVQGRQRPVRRLHQPGDLRPGDPVGTSSPCGHSTPS